VWQLVSGSVKILTWNRNFNQQIGRRSTVDTVLFGLMESD